ncbi:MAG: hypothetical protein HDR80_04840 [Bacteroides sp.]|nr:hypothetical protein [Bacteroides sp.]
MSGDVNGFKQLTADASDLRRIMTETIVEADRLKDSIFNYAAAVTVLESARQGLESLAGVCRNLSDAYASQVEVETKLAVNMRNTMDAREEDIQSIKDLCAAQQELGVVGDEVQLAGAQELATYLTKKESLAALIPVMNDMLVQQYGLAASQENAAQIATMLGKVMDGQTGALKRYGYTFDDIQDNILKTGDEMSRAAVLCDVISSSVGGMNAEMAKTDSGKITQMNNAIGDLKEKLGSLAQKALPFLTIVSESGMALIGITKLATGVKAMASTYATGVKSIKAFWLATATMTSRTTGLVKVVGTARLFVTQFCSALTQGTQGLRLFAIAWRGVLVSTGIGIAIAAVTTALGYFALKTSEATKEANRFVEAREKVSEEARKGTLAEEEYVQAATEAKTQIEKDITALNFLIESKKDTTEAVAEMNRKYGEMFGYQKTAADWYDILTSKCETYARAMGLVAQSQSLYQQKAKHDIEAAQAQRDMDRLEAAGNKTTKKKVWKTSGYSSSYGSVPSVGWYDVETDEYRAARRKRDAAKEASDAISDQLGVIKTLSEEEKLNLVVSTPAKTPKTKTKSSSGSAKKQDPVWTEAPETLREYEDNISILTKRLDDCDKEGAIAINRQIKLFRDAADAIRKAGVEEEKVEKQWHDTPASLREVNENLAILRDRLEQAPIDKAAGINAQIREQEKLAESFRNAGIEAKDTKPKYDATAASIKQIADNISVLTDELENTTDLSRATELNREIELWNKKADAIRRAGEEGESWSEIMSKGWSRVKATEGGIRTLTEALQGNGDAWSMVTGIVDGFIQIYEGISSIVEIVNSLTKANELFTASKTAEAAATGAAATAQTAETATSEAAATAQIPVIAANKAAAGSFMELAAASYFAAHASIPFAGFGIASGFVASATAMVEAIGVMPFADGGIVSGPTVGLIGEYAGASSNPEVVAPLDKLRSMLKTTGEPVVVGGTFRISGRDLVGVLANETRIASKTGRKTNIKI